MRGRHSGGSRNPGFQSSRALRANPNANCGSRTGRSRHPASRDTCTSLYIAGGFLSLACPRERNQRSGPNAHPSAGQTFVHPCTSRGPPGRSPRRIRAVPCAPRAPQRAPNSPSAGQRAAGSNSRRATALGRPAVLGSLGRGLKPQHQHTPFGNSGGVSFFGSGPRSRRRASQQESGEASLLFEPAARCLRSAS
jgi:hypothetical protein